MVILLLNCTVKMKTLKEIFVEIIDAPIRDLYDNKYLLKIMSDIGIFSDFEGYCFPKNEGFYVPPRLEEEIREAVSEHAPRNRFFLDSYHSIYDRCCVSSKGRMIQKRGEVLEFIKYVREKDIKKYGEVGVWRGGLFTMMTALLIRYNKNFELSVAVDPKDVDLDFIGEYCTLDYYCTSEEVSDVFDLCFIDGDHTYDWVRKDWNNVGVNSAIVAFHDIKHHSLPGVTRCWEEVSRHLPSVEFVHPPINVMGIGVVVNRGSL